ncbi:MAG: peptide chain release factor N(5)-glutamine methyltransferase [Gammaproteobacteria bacterium]
MQTLRHLTGVTIKELLRQAEQRLRGSDSPRRDAEVLLCHVTGLDRSRLYSSPELAIESSAVTAFLARVTERGAGIPVAYLTGEKEFWSLSLRVNVHTLIPRPETECLVEAALQRLPEDQELYVADLGTGCGVIAIALAKERPACRITATDLSSEALAVAGHNARQYQLHQISFVPGDWFDALTGTFDLIVSNPPYVRKDEAHLRHTDIRHEPRLALCGGDDGMDALRHIIATAPRYLKAGGWLCLEHGCDQGPAVRSIFSDHGFTDIVTIQDYAGLERVCCGRYGPAQEFCKD